MNSIEKKLTARTKATRYMMMYKTAQTVFSMLPDSDKALRGRLNVMGEITTIIDIARCAVIKACMIDNKPYKFGVDAYRILALNKY